MHGSYRAMKLQFLSKWLTLLPQCLLLILPPIMYSCNGLNPTTFCMAVLKYKDHQKIDSITCTVMLNLNKHLHVYYI